MARTVTLRRAVLPVPLVLVGMALGAALIYRTVSLPLIVVGLMVFGGLALVRPNLALLFIPITVPWYLSPVYVPDIRATGTVFPLHEVLLLVVFATTLAHEAGRLIIAHHAVRRPSLSFQQLVFLAPIACFFVAGVFGVLIAIERSPALRDFRWMIVEPLIFYGLFCLFQWREAAYTQHMLAALVVSGACVATLGLLQAVNVNLVPVLLSPTKSFAESVVETGNVARVASVYGHPNNLGMFLGRVWPLAVVLALGQRRGSIRSLSRMLAVLAAVLCFGGLVVSFSRGAWLGALAALAVFMIGWLASRPEQRRRTIIWLVACGSVGAVVGGLVVTLRGGLIGGSTDIRLLFWREALELIARHPFGLGLDQYYYYHNPEFGRNLIDAALLPPSEWFAKHPHNMLFEVWLLLTPLGLFAFGWLLVRFFRNAIAILQSVPQAQSGLFVLGVCAAMVAALVHGLVDIFYFWPDLAVTFWLFIAVVDNAAMHKANS